MFGVRYTSDAILVIVPSSSSMWKPTLVDCIKDSSITATNIEDRLATALEKAKDMLKVLAIQRERLETFRRDRAEQEEDLLKAQEQDSNEKNEGEEKEKDKIEEKQKEEDNNIRGKRKSRVPEEVTEGPKTVKIVLRHSNGKMERCFKKGAFFQEVYDWAGADKTLPLHFSIQRGRQVIRHQDTLRTPEVLDVYGRDEREIITLLGTKVSFRGNVPSDELSESELSTTLIDATQEEQREEEEEEEEEEKKSEEEKKEEQRREEGKEEERREEERKEEEKKEQERKEEEKKEQEKKEEAKKEQERKEEERDQEKNEDSKKAQYSRNEQENKDEERKEEGKLQRKRKKDKRSNAERKRFKKNK